jgi:hypothetical protein
MSHSVEAAAEKNALAVTTLPEERSWIVAFTSLLFIALQSACTAVVALSGVRVFLGLGSLAAAAGLHHRASGFHADAIRIPMMIVAVGGSVLNLYALWRAHTLRRRPSAQWRVRPLTVQEKRKRSLQLILAVVTLLLVAAEYLTHLRVHNA